MTRFSKAEVSLARQITPPTKKTAMQHHQRIKKDLSVNPCCVWIWWVFHVLGHMLTMFDLLSARSVVTTTTVPDRHRSPYNTKYTQRDTLAESQETTDNITDRHQTHKERQRQTHETTQQRNTKHATRVRQDETRQDETRRDRTEQDKCTSTSTSTSTSTGCGSHWGPCVLGIQIPLFLGIPV